MREARFLARKDLRQLFDRLKESGYEIVGPQVADGVIAFGPLSSPDQLPWGVQDEQDAGSYRLVEGPVNRAFFWTSAAQALKPVIFPPRETLWHVRRDDDGRLTFAESTPQSAPRAIIGARACDLAALDLQDRHFHARNDPWYRARRDALLVIGVNCARAVSTCFCNSTRDGPSVQAAHDLLLDELDDGFIVRTGSEKGEALLTTCHWQEASARQLADANSQTEAAANSQTRGLPQIDLEAALNARAKAGAWQAIADQCLACGNCTAVCPSCFCHRHTEEPSLDGATSAHGREWDSCFGNDHSLMHGQPHRREIAHRYRQWLSHKLGTWHSQYGRSGCTGCGRCITWCPVAIDFTKSISTLVREAPS